MDRVKAKKFENTFKGVANATRLRIVALLKQKGEMTVFDIAEQLELNGKTVAVHVTTLARSKLVYKNTDGPFRKVTLTKNGESILTFLRMLE